MSEKKKPTAAAPEPSLAELLSALQESQRQNAELRALFDQQASANNALTTRLGAINPNHQNPYSEVMVGIRSCSDNTIGIPGAFGQPPLQLHADLGHNDPGSTAIIPYAWWKELRKGKYVRRGLICRDDTILGGLPKAPDDRPADMPEESLLNTVPNPVAWIEMRTEKNIRQDLGKITSEETLLRIRRVVDDAIVELESQRPRSTKQEQVAAAKWALAELPGKYRLVDDLITQRLEGRDKAEEPDGRLSIS